MCLGEVGRVVELRRGGWARVHTADRTVAVSLVTLDAPVEVGDWVVMHAGFALDRLSVAEAQDALALRAGLSPAATAAPRTPLEGSA
ncbi:HypC/HybG/HupF family hydrogenase formation chaperone [Pengzhenrongella frigida]|uniref:HypC/HybG/HupF family hydrogenase formation chaperone n=1 Tax=Pengzhenrongella frigida TaxID=1259133 RepID=A0A4Q5N483_9MICO|nr:HypC/HybG/HupF family hydrogenase formation chaperone [Cellulomonas sp. HLT2-17]RYV50821.1 HypC/HybG/HupF family hydrogenase formation chaperone [Cellulomonas sp. HLT2-17]